MKAEPELISVNDARPMRVARALRCAVALALALYAIGKASAEATPATPAQPQLQVLHWWTSASEARAVKLLASRLADEKITWQDASIPGGAGVGAGRVLKSRLFAGTPPDVTQLIGLNIADWAKLGMLQDLNAVASKNNWEANLYPEVWKLVQHQGRAVAAPLGIHRINNLYYHRPLFKKLGLAAPKNWDEFGRVAQKLRQAGVVPLAQSSEPWQVATLFENLVLAQGGVDYYRALLVEQAPAAFADERLTRALQRLRELKKWMPQPLREQPWVDTARQLAQGQAGMLIGGDWIKGELNSADNGANPATPGNSGNSANLANPAAPARFLLDARVACSVVPDTFDLHLYSVDTLVMLSGKNAKAPAAQEKLAQLLVSETTQLDYNTLKGSIPVLRQLEVSRKDSCALDSARVFAKGRAVQAPSLVHRMASDEIRREAMIAEIHRFFMDERVSVLETRQQLAAIGK
jgi:glucose/mannose transport system substrate-binding protein